MPFEAPPSAWPDPAALGPVTDLYQLTMMAGYAASGLDRATATFEVFVRKMPAHRAYLVFAGLEQVVGDILRLRFSAEQVDAIRGLPVFARADPAWFRTLSEIRFRGDLWAIPEGTVVFPGEPLVRVTAPLAEAQWVETYLLASLGYPTLVASKASRIVEAAAGRKLYDFGLRRGHGPQAGYLAARAAYIAGFDGTSNVEAATRLGIPCVGTMAHAWVQAFPTEAEAFAAFARTYPDRPTLLVDTFDTARGVRLAAAVEPPIGAVRIDSGDIAIEARRARQILDGLGRQDVQIVASGDLDEAEIARIVEAGTPVDAFGVGTELITSRDAPALSIVYKLVELDGVGKIKLSPGKKTYPMAKQVYRTLDRDGRFACDHVTRADEVVPGEPLLVPVIRGGELVADLPTLERCRSHARAQAAMLPDRLRGVDAAPSYPMAYRWSLELEAERLGVR